MTGNELNEIREDGKEFAELAKKIPKEKKREALRLLEGFFAVCRIFGKESRVGGGDIGDERKIQKCRAAFEQNN